MAQRRRRIPPPSRSRSLLPLRGSTLSGLVAPSCLPSPPSSRCGSPSRSTTSAAHPLSIGSASKCFVTAKEVPLSCAITYILFCPVIYITEHHECFMSMPNNIHSECLKDYVLHPVGMQLKIHSMQTA